MIKCYVINLDKDTERLAFMMKNFENVGVQAERFPAVDGRLFPAEQFERFVSERPRKGKKTWMRGQMGCFLSHYGVWQKIAESDARFGAVFEDDVYLSPALTPLLTEDQWLPDSVDLVRLDTSTNRLLLGRTAEICAAGRDFFSVQSTSWCAGGYIINRRTALQLLDLAPRHHHPADVLLYNYEQSVITPKLKILQSCPALVTQDKQEGGKIGFVSNIESPLQALRQDRITDVIPAIYRTLAGYKRIHFQY